MSFTDEFIADSEKFEKLMIGKLRDDRESIQAKTYKNWVNSVLIKVVIYHNISHIIHLKSQFVITIIK